MSNEEFNNSEFMFYILERLHLRNNSFFCLGGFNVNLLNYETNRPTDKFLDDIYSHSFVSLYHTPNSHLHQKLWLITFSLMVSMKW